MDIGREYIVLNYTAGCSVKNRWDPSTFMNARDKFVSNCSLAYFCSNIINSKSR